MPLDPKLQKFTTAKQSIISYDSVDIASGTAVTAFYAFRSTDDSGVDYHLTTDTSVLASEVDYSTVPTNTSVFEKKMDLDYDLTTAVLPQTLQGTATINFPLRCGGAGSGGLRANAYVIVKIRKWNGTTETEIANVQTETLTPTTDDVIKSLRVRITIPKTIIAAGENISVTMEVWAKKFSGGGNRASIYVAIAADPANRDGTFFTASDTPTQMVIRMPFDPDL